MPFLFQAGVVMRRVSKSKRACLVMPVAKVLAGLKKGRYAPRVGESAYSILLISNQR